MNKSFKMLGFISENTKEFRHPFHLKTLYTSLVKSNLDFGSLIWSSNYVTYINDLDNTIHILKWISFTSNILLSSNNLHLTQNYIGLIPLSLILM